MCYQAGQKYFSTYQVLWWSVLAKCIKCNKCIVFLLASFYITLARLAQFLSTFSNTPFDMGLMHKQWLTAFKCSCCFKYICLWPVVMFEYNMHEQRQLTYDNFALCQKPARGRFHQAKGYLVPAQPISDASRPLLLGFRCRCGLDNALRTWY